MPCYDPPTKQDELDKKMPAVLCGMVRKFGAQTVIESVDWEQAGVTKEDFLTWWRYHQEEDRSKEFKEKLKLIKLRDEGISHIDPWTCGASWRFRIMNEARINFAYFQLVVGTGHGAGGFPDWLKEALGKAPHPTEAK